MDFEPLVPPKMDDAFEAAVPRTPPPGDDPEKPKSSSQESKRTRLRDKGGLGESKMAGFGRVGIVPEQILVGGGAGGQAAGRQAGIGDVGQAEQHRVGDGFMHQRIAVDQMQIETVAPREAGERLLQKASNPAVKMEASAATVGPCARNAGARPRSGTFSTSKLRAPLAARSPTKVAILPMTAAASAFACAGLPASRVRIVCRSSPPIDSV